MPTYPIEPDKLLVAATQLAPATVGRGRPSYTAHRRAVSTAYYAVFHAMSARTVQTVFPAADALFVRRIQRWINHGDLAQVSRWMGQMSGTVRDTPPKHIGELLRLTPVHQDSDVTAIASGFREMDEKREQADYDHAAVFTRPDTLRLIEVARDTVQLVDAAPAGPVDRFFGLVAMQARIVGR